MNATGNYIKVQPKTPAATFNNNEAFIKARKEDQLCKAYNSGSCDREDPANPGICKINNAIIIHECKFRSNGEIGGKNHARINHQWILCCDFRIFGGLFVLCLSSHYYIR